MKIFGNDGFRSEFGSKYMTFDFIVNFASGLVEFYSKNNFYSPILIGKDTRFSCDLIEQILISVFKYNNIDTFSVGIIPTPGLSFVCSKYKPTLGIMITASHDPYTNNGIKLFANTGYKLGVNIEKEIELLIINSMNENSQQKYAGELGTNSIQYDYTDSYVENIRDLLGKFILKYKILIDCSNGAYYDIVKDVFCDYSNISIINDSPDGQNINLNCGALEVSNLLQKVRNNNYDFGVAFDGDGDRAMFVSNDYGIIETEKLIILLSEFFKNDQEKIIVSTEICNKGLEVNAEITGHKLIQTEVGDRNVVIKTLSENAIIGAEPSGHYFFPNDSFSMDGLIATIYFMKLLDSFGKESINKRLCSLHHYNRIIKNIEIKKNRDFNALLSFTKNNSIINSSEKLVIRESMWDPVIRVYYDYQTVNNFKLIEMILKKEVIE